MAQQYAELEALRAALALRFVQFPGSTFELRGVGSPEGVLTAAVGNYYTDTASTLGATRWYKKTGTGNTGWKCVEGDTGLRRIDYADFAAPFNVTGPASTAYVRRIGDVVHCSVILYTASTLAAGNYPYVPAATPYLWGLGANIFGVVGSGPLWNSNNGTNLGSINSSTVVIPASVPAGTPMRGTVTQVWAAAWPTTLPGTAT